MVRMILLRISGCTCYVRGRTSYDYVMSVWSTMLLKWMPGMYGNTIGADHKVITYRVTSRYCYAIT